MKELDMNKETLMNLPTEEEYKMKNIHILPTDKPSRLSKNKKGLFLQKYIYKNDVSISFGLKNQNIYITSDEEIKEGDWVYHPDVSQEYTKVNLSKEGDERYTKGQHVAQGVYKHKPTTNEWYKKERKIILTTDQDLIKDGVQVIDEEFLEWFVKNPSCENVEVESFCKYGDDCPSQGAFDKKHLCDIGYKIIIPKEESKKETLEEVAKRIYGTDESKDVEYYAFILGAKWQAERMYSEEKVKQIIDKTLIEYSDFVLADIPHWFEQFKKK